MKNGKNLTHKQKVTLTMAGWDPDRYWISYDLKNTMVLKDKETGEFIVFDKLSEDGR